MPVIDATGAAAPDESTFTAGATPMVPAGVVYNDSAATLSTGQQGTVRGTPNRAAHVNLRTQAGAEVGIAALPLQVSLANTAANGVAVAVSGTFFQASQPVSIATAPALVASTAIIGKVGIDPANNGVSFSDLSTAGTITALQASIPSNVTTSTGSHIILPLLGRATWHVLLSTLPASMTLNFALSWDGVTYSAVAATQLFASNAATSSTTSANNLSAKGNTQSWTGLTGGAAYLAVWCSAFASGSATATISAGAVAHSMPVDATGAALFTTTTPGAVTTPFAQADPAVTTPIGDTMLASPDQATWAPSNKTQLATSTVLVLANLRVTTGTLDLGRRGLIIANAATSDLYIFYGATATLTTAWTYRIPANTTWEMPSPIYADVISGIWAAAGSGSANIQEAG